MDYLDEMRLKMAKLEKGHIHSQIGSTVSGSDGSPTF